MALLTPKLITVTIKSVYLSMSPADLTAEKSAEPRAASSDDWNTSLLVWSNLYLGGYWMNSYVVMHELKLQWVGVQCLYLKLDVMFCQVW